MKIVFAFLFLVAVAIALPIEDESESQLANENEFLNLEPVEQHHRERRATCRLPWGARTACNAHCRSKKYKRGYCNSNRICVCTNK
ncbi:defensin-like [Pogonomyrmex barbatus]|uniref:Defensin-like n=1 Tax=Pogonomyrmex barbatus TaxID=144034 RepID=A0A6I9W8C6_9HYME|nr:defensin-like [Pogonomyrmex barbatus]